MTPRNDITFLKNNFALCEPIKFEDDFCYDVAYDVTNRSCLVGYNICCFLCQIDVACESATKLAIILMTLQKFNS